MTVAVGIIAAVMTTACWGPQLFRTLRRGTADDFAWVYLTMLTVGVFCWTLYGALKRDPVIWVANAIVTTSALIVVVVKLRSRHFVIDDIEIVMAHEDDPLQALETLITLGPKIAADLRSVGIPDADTLRTVGVDEANRRLVSAGLAEHTPLGEAGANAFSGGRFSAARRTGGRRRASRGTADT
jgi:MtN3 and saliva related transmembrane protein